MDYRGISKIDRVVFDEKLDYALLWATGQAKDFCLDMDLDINKRWAKLTKAIGDKFPKLSHEAGVFLASAAMLSAKIGG